MQTLKSLLFVAITIFSFTLNGQKAKISSKKVLIVVSSYGKGTIRPGFELDELSQAYHIFKDHGVAIDIASPRGGKVIPDRFNEKKAYNASFIKNLEATSKLDNTLSTAQAFAKNDYHAIYIVGGKGAMFDLPYDPALQDLILAMYEKSRVVSAVCHGSAALLHIKSNDSTFLVQNKAITGLCNEEETKFGKKWIKEFPYLLETKMIERGAKYQREEIMLPFVIKDGNIITGQNPFSTTQLSEEILRSLGIEPKPRILYTDEKSMNLVKRASKGDYEWAKEELENYKESYDLELIAVYGYYGLLYAGEDKDVNWKALKILDVVAPHYFNERMQLERAKGLVKVSEYAKARMLLNELIDKNLMKNEALDVLKNIDKLASND